jgi:hypothetical protein
MNVQRFLCWILRAHVWSHWRCILCGKSQTLRNDFGKPRKLGLIFVYPWSSGDWMFWPSFTRWGKGGEPMKAVALSFNRAAIVFDIDWYLEWKGATK